MNSNEPEKFKVPKRLHEQAPPENPPQAVQLPEAFVPSAESTEEVGKLIGDISTAGALINNDSRDTEEDGETFSPISDSAEELFEVPPNITVGETVSSPNTPEKLRPTNLVEVRKEIEDDIDVALEAWGKYKRGKRVEPYRWPANRESLSRYNRNLDVVLEKLAQTKLDLIEFGNSPNGKTPGGENIGETLHPVLIPWEFFSKNSDPGKLVPALQNLRDAQRIKEHVRDYPFVLDQLADYELKEAYHSEPYSNRAFSSMFRDAKSNTEHLRGMFYSDGWWGVMLMQTGKDVGASSINFEEQIEEKGSFTLSGYDIGRLGIYEWLALTLQAGPETFHDTEDENLIANRIFYESDRKQTRFLYAGWDNKLKRFRQYWIGGGDKDGKQLPLPSFRLRLAISPHIERAKEN